MASRGGEPRAVPTQTALYKHFAVAATFSELGDVENAAIYVRDNVIAWVGPTTDLPTELQTADTVRRPLGGKLPSPNRCWRCLREP